MNIVLFIDQMCKDLESKNCDIQNPCTISSTMKDRYGDNLSPLSATEAVLFTSSITTCKLKFITMTIFLIFVFIQDTHTHRNIYIICTALLTVLYQPLNQLDYSCITDCNMTTPYAAKDENIIKVTFSIQSIVIALVCGMLYTSYNSFTHCKQSILKLWYNVHINENMRYS